MSSVPRKPSKLLPSDPGELDVPLERLAKCSRRPNDPLVQETIDIAPLRPTWQGNRGIVVTRWNIADPTLRRKAKLSLDRPHACAL